jgi:hypothetical protein
MESGIIDLDSIVLDIETAEFLGEKQTEHPEETVTAGRWKRNIPLLLHLNRKRWT